jgi:hypothetical protein
MPSLLRSSLTPAHRFARVLELPNTSAARTSRLAVRGSAAPRGFSGLERSVYPPRSADRAACDGLARPPAPRLATVRGARARCVRPTSASHCFDYEHSRRVRSQHLFETCVSPLRPRACALEDGDWGTQRFTTPDSLRRAASGSHAALFFRALPRPTVPLAPLSPPRGSRSLTRSVRSAESAKTVLCRRSVKIRLPRRSRMPSIASPPRHARAHPPRKRSREVSASIVGASVSSPAATYSRTWGRELGARP